jgi:hypothetical protein
MSEVDREYDDPLDYYKLSKELRAEVERLRGELKMEHTALMYASRAINRYKPKAELWDCLERQAEEQAEIPPGNFNYRLKYLIASIKTALKAAKEQG